MKTAAQILKGKQAVRAELDARMPKEESDALWEQAERRLAEIRKRYAGVRKGERIHTDRYIFPSAAVYQTVREATDDETAYAVIENAAVKNSGEVGRKLAGLMRLPGMRGLFVRIWDPMVRKCSARTAGSGTGFTRRRRENTAWISWPVPMTGILRNWAARNSQGSSAPTTSAATGISRGWNSGGPGLSAPAPTAVISF